MLDPASIGHVWSLKREDPPTDFGPDCLASLTLAALTTPRLWGLLRTSTSLHGESYTKNTAPCSASDNGFLGHTHQNAAEGRGFRQGIKRSPLE